MQDIKVSVIIPVYNAEKYLAECLESVLGQTLREIEIICVDDGSADSSPEILRKYAAKDSRIQIKYQRNRGAGAARNLGMPTARGTYLAFLDADDAYFREALSAAYEKASCLDADILLFGAEYFGGANALLREETVNTSLLTDTQTFSAADIPQFIFQIASCNTWNKLYRREFIYKARLNYQEIATANDLCFTYAAMARAERIARLDRPLIRHRVLYRGNLQSLKRKTPADFISALIRLKENLRQSGLWEKLRQSYLNCALFHCVFNYRTVGFSGRKQIAARAGELYDLLEFGEHGREYYYNSYDYQLLYGALSHSGERGATRMSGIVPLLQKIKNMLKHILPPPVNAFNREIGGLRQYTLELNAGIAARLAQQTRLVEEQGRQLQELRYTLACQQKELESRQQEISAMLHRLEGTAVVLRDSACAEMEGAVREHCARLEDAIKKSAEEQTT